MISEIGTYLERITELRGKVWTNLDGLTPEALNWTPLPQDTNSLIVLATHSIGAEHGWIGEVIGHEPETRIRAAEFHAQASALEALQDRYEAVARETEHVLAGLTASDLDTTRDSKRRYGVVTVRWIILHVIEHYAEHEGQMSLTRQLYQAKSKFGEQKNA